MTAPLTGEITTMLAALGQQEFDEGGLGLLGLVGPTYEDEAYPGELYRTFPRMGAAVNYEETDTGMVAQTVFVYLEARDGAEPYPTPDRLIDGLALTSAGREAIRARLGEPVLAKDGFDAFAVGERYLHVEYRADGSPAMVTAMIDVPGL